jgi:uncharacterized protein YbaP (TraB family)
MKKKNPLLLLLIATCIQLSLCQSSFSQKLPSTLLWRISGNGLQKSSYLFGTLHLTDERVFNLGDSLYKSIEQTDGFAIEVDPQEFTPLMIDEVKKEVYQKGQPIKELMSSGQYEKYGKMLAKKLNKKADEITTADILNEKNKWIRQSFKNGKMQTFLDAYLFDIARRLGKWTGGVEDMKDQQGLTDLVDESDIEQIAIGGSGDNMKEDNKNAEYLINAYIDNDLNKIDRISSSQDSLFEDALLFKRNKKMARRMDSLSQLRSMVFAVGAAHLPGGKGLIALLREKGFTVTPVFSSKKIKPSDYKVKEVPLTWYDVKDEQGLYKASMPGKPGDITFYGIMNMKMYFDIFSSTLYMTTAVKTPYSPKMADSVLGAMATYYFGNAKGKPITINNIPGKEFISEKQNYSHGYLLFKDGKMYIALGLSTKSGRAGEPAINRFLHSFSITEKAPDTSRIFTYTNKIKAYHLEVPGEPTSGDDYSKATKKDSGIVTKLNIASDPVTGAYFFFGTNEAAPGYNLENDSVMLVAIRASQLSKFKRMSMDTAYIKNGCRILDLAGMMAQAPLMMKARFQFRGNRWYGLVAIYDTAKDKSSVQRFFSSFTTLDYAPVKWDNHTAADNSFSTWSPTAFTYQPNKKDEDGNREWKYECYDSSRGDNYEIIANEFSKYYWQNSDSALWNEVTGRYNSDSVIVKKKISNNGLKGYELALKANGSSNVKRLRFFLNNGKLYTLMALQAAGEINNENTNKFFESFHFTSIHPDTNVLVSKAALLLTDMGSPDSSVSCSAVKYLTIVPFTKEDLPLLHRALLKNYPEPGYSAGEIKNKLKKIILNFKDPSSFIFAKNNYATANDTTRNLLLSIMASFPTEENYNDIKTLLLKQPPMVDPGYQFINPLSDSLQLTATILPDLLPLLKDTAMGPSLINLSNQLLDSGLVHKNIFKPYHPDILKLSGRELALLKEDPDNYSYYDYLLVDLMGKMNTPEFNAVLQKWSVLSTPSYIALQAVNSLLRNNQPINPVAIAALAKDNSSRIELYDTLKAYHKTNLFPAAYFTQKSFGESYAFTADEDNTPAAVTYLLQKVINFKGRQSRFYFYKLTFHDGDDTTYSLACAGPFNVNIQEVSSKDATGVIYYDEDFEQSEVQKQSASLIKQMEDWFEWSDKKENK